MAKFVSLLENKCWYEEEIYHAIRLAECCRDCEYEACVRIQAWYRGTKVRAYLRHLNNCATKIQKRWRGAKGRDFAKALKKYREEARWMYHCNVMATKIQKIWRGHHSRKCLFNFRERKKHFQGVALVNELVRMELNMKALELEQEQRLMEEQRNEQLVQRWAEKHHYLLSTQTVPGIYNSPYRCQPDCIEVRLRQVKVKVTERPKTSVKEFNRGDMEEPFGACRPPLEKQQGPFRNPDSVRKIKCKSPTLSLRAQTDYESVFKARQKHKSEEWSKRIDDKDFVVSGKLPPLQYQPSLCYAGPYLNPTKNKTEYAIKNFRTTFPPIDDCNA